MTQQTNRYWLPASLIFTGLLLLIRIIYTGTLQYIFLGWNLFLACIPLAISWYCIQQPLPRRRMAQYAGLIAWLLFFPNAPYLITDLFHFTERKPVPLYYDLVLMFMMAFNGLLLGFLSLTNAEFQWKRMYPAFPLPVFRVAALFLCSFGIYLGRYGRFNSWDVLSDPGSLLVNIAHRFIYPFEHLRTWSVTVLFTAMLFLLYTSLQANYRNVERDKPGQF